MLVFSALFGTISWYGRENRGVFQKAQALLTQPLGLLNTVVLIVGSALVVAAVGAVEQSRYRTAANLLRAAMGCGAMFGLVKAVEYGLVVHHGAWIHTNAFWMLFFAVTGAHLLHVVVGTTVLGIARCRVATGLTGPRDRELFVSATCYWHLVDLLWLVLFALFYLVN